MRPIHFLETFTGVQCPGRFAIKSEPLVGPDASKSLSAKERRERAQIQAEALVDYCTTIHEISRRSLVAAFGAVLKELENRPAIDPARGLREETFRNIRDACYPYLYISAADIRASLDVQYFGWDHSPLVLPPRDHMTTIAEPKLLRSYYVEQCRDLLNKGYPIEAGLSIIPMPVTYAIEGSELVDVPAQKKVLDAIQMYFPATTPIDMEDGVVDGRYRRRDESIVGNNDYGLYTSIFWSDYLKYLSTAGKPVDYVKERSWRTELLLADPGSVPARLRDDLSIGRSQAIQGTFTRSMSSLDAEGKPLAQGIVAPRTPEVGRAHRGSSDPRHSMSVAKPLSYFDAPRTHFALARISHYTHTDPTHFQRSILLTNHPEYAKQFVLRALVEVHRLGKAAGGLSGRIGQLVVSPPDEKVPGARGGRIVTYDRLKEFFKGKDGALGANLSWLETVEQLLKDGVVIDELDGADPKRRAYEACLTVIRDERLVGASEARMPAYHYIAPAEAFEDRDGPRNVETEQKLRELILEGSQLPSMTMIDFGVGPTNAKAITDVLAPLRPRCWILVSRCGGLRKQQQLGDYVFATSHVRRDAVLDSQVPLDAPIKTTRAILHAFETAMDYHLKHDKDLSKRAEPQDGGISKLKSWRLKSTTAEDLTDEQREARFHAKRQILRHGTVVSTNDRNWETRPADEMFEEFNLYRAIAIDMESGAIAANGYRYRVHHGAFLCVSEKPLDGSVRIRQHKNGFFSKQTGRHLSIAMSAVRWLEYNFESAALLQYSRELRGTDDPPWD
jgi:nucleoside phosphorylase